MARGGKRTPRNPAPVSGPGALSRRTDGGPGQPVRVPGGQPYGQRQQSENLQRAAPLASPRPATATPGAGSRPSFPASQPAPGGNLFRPTDRPTEPANTGLAAGQQLPPDPDALIRVLYSIYPHPDLARLIGYDQSP